MLTILQIPVDLVTFTEKILNGKLHSLCNANKEQGNRESNVFLATS